MAVLNLSLVVPEADQADLKAASESFTQKEGVTPKELLAAVANTLIENYRRNKAAVAKPGVT